MASPTIRSVQTVRLPPRDVASPDPPDDDAGVGGDDVGRPDPRWTRAVPVLLVVLAGLPLAVAVGVLRRPTWYPLGEMAQAELRVRDVWTGHPPLLGLGGRIGSGAAQGSHPGPLSFWSLAPLHRLFGSDAWALHAATASLHLVALGLCLWIARRRGGLGLLLATAVALMVLAKAYGPYLLTEPWNPYLPMFWWMAFLLAVWSVVCGDLPMFPLAVFAGTFCVQTHISYTALGTALGATSVVALAWWLRDRWADVGARRSAIRWIVAGAALGALLWSPPVVEQLGSTEGGNLGRILLYFRNPPEEPIGLRPGVEMLLRHLNPERILAELPGPRVVVVGGSLVPGAVLLVAWAGSVMVAWRRRHRPLLALDLILAVALVAGVASTSRIFGPPLFYLTLWAWGLCIGLVLAVGWAAALVIDTAVPTGIRPRFVAVATGVAVVALLTVTGLATLDAAYVEVVAPDVVHSLDRIVPPTIAALEADPRTRDRDGPYLLTWSDRLYHGGRGYALFNELDRAGFDVRADPSWRVPLTEHRTIDPADAEAEIHLASGSDIERWRRRPGFDELVYVDDATPAERAEYRRLRDEVAAELKAMDLHKFVPSLERDPHELGFDPDYSEPLIRRVGRMVEIGLPVAVFLGPPRT